MGGRHRGMKEMHRRGEREIVDKENKQVRSMLRERKRQNNKWETITVIKGTKLEEVGLESACSVWPQEGVYSSNLTVCNL